MTGSRNGLWREIDARRCRWQGQETAYSVVGRVRKWLMVWMIGLENGLRFERDARRRESQGQ